MPYRAIHANPIFLKVLMHKSTFRQGTDIVYCVVLLLAETNISAGFKYMRTILCMCLIKRFFIFCSVSFIYYSVGSTFYMHKQANPISI